MITLNGLRKQFNQLAVVKGIDLTIKPGEIVGLLGPNGAGKTTTIRMIAGVLPPSKGSVSIDGRTFENNEQELKQLIGYLPENNPLYDEMTVEEHLQFWARMKQIAKENQSDAIDFAVDRTGIEDVYYRFISELSKGYRQRVGLAQAILNKPEILLLDEPTEGLDPNQRRDIQELLAELKKSRTVIVSSHVLSEISHIASRIVIIHQGKIVGDDSPKNLVRGNGKSNQVLWVEIQGKGVIMGLKQIEGVKTIEKTGANEYKIQTQAKKDIRAHIFKQAVAKGWILLRMQQQERQLEDVFSELTH